MDDRDGRQAGGGVAGREDVPFAASAGAGNGAIGPERRDLIERAREQWAERLVDTSRRNSLLYFRHLKTGSLDLGEIAPDLLGGILAGESVALRSLLPEGDPEEISGRVLRIRRQAIANAEEKGLQTLFLALGLATWRPSDGGSPPAAPVLLVPIAIESRGTKGHSFGLRRAGEVQPNLTLLQVLETLGCAIQPAAVLGGDEAADSDEAFEPGAIFARLQAAARDLDGFVIAPRWVVGNFSFQKLAMVQDLREQADKLAASDLVAALAGDVEARTDFQQERFSIDPSELDTIPPDSEYLVLDADSSQQAVIQAVLKGQSGVIQGPPGTGKSQTISNLIAALIGEGKSVLFVAEKRAALEVVLRRLEGAGLGQLALDLHGADISRKSLMRRLGAMLDQVRTTPPVDGEALHERFVERRDQLNAHVARIHSPRPPSGLSVYAMMGRLLRAPPEARTRLTRWRGAELGAVDVGARGELRALFVEAAGFGDLLRGDSPSPWAGARISTGAQVSEAVDLVQRLRGQLWPDLRRALAEVVAATGLPAPATLAETEGLVALLEAVGATLERYDPGIYRADLAAWASSLAPAERWFGRRWWADLLDRDYRAVKAQARALRVAGKLGAAQLRREVVAAGEQLAEWRERGGPAPLPVSYPGATETRRYLDAVGGALGALAPLLDARHGLARSGDLEIDALDDLLERLAADLATPYRLPRLREIRAEIEKRGAGRLLDELRTGEYDPARWGDAFDYTWLSSCLDRARAEDPSLAGFNGRTHETFVREFVELDGQRIHIADDRVRRTHAERVISALNAFPEQADLVRREVHKRSRHLPLRTLLREAPAALMAICPCWMASPLTVSQLIGADRAYFDIVIFDEASQVLPENAVPALLRARQAVVAGDSHQLPPTTFFAGGADEDDADDAAAVAGFESILDLMGAVFAPSWPLRWHYRSRDETLIAFSNQEIYDGSLITFPGSGGDRAISHVLVATAPGREDQRLSPDEEVRAVVDLVLRHAQERPAESLGVIALGIKHAERIQLALDRALEGRPELGGFFDEGRADRFFVKNLERVQGDERDAIILSVGCGKDRTGRVSRTQFGPLNSRNVGPRRLNVAITRARSRMTVVSAFTHEDLAPSASDDTGTDLLRKYLEYAASGGRRLSSDGGTLIAPNPFERDVQEALEKAGMKLHPQWGASSYRIDLVAEHPKRPGRFVLAIECDGASYHSAPTARDRDRLRQQHLEALGWRFHRIWSTDWFMRRDQEIQRAVAAYQEAVRRADGPARAAPPAEAEAEPVQTAKPDPRGPRPDVPRYDQIDRYSEEQVDRLISWIQSDGLLRTDEEILDLMVPELGFHRRGVRIEEAVRAGIERWRLSL